MALLGVFGASQVAGVLPGLNGASPREGALVVGLASVGVPRGAAAAAVALKAAVAWLAGPGPGRRQPRPHPPSRPLGRFPRAPVPS